VSKRIRRIVAGITLATAATFTVSVAVAVNDLLAVQDDTTWGAPATVDSTVATTDGIPGVGVSVDGTTDVDLTITPLDTTWG
jgi:hypothetical protein